MMTSGELIVCPALGTLIHAKGKVSCRLSGIDIHLGPALRRYGAGDTSNRRAERPDESIRTMCGT